MIAACFLNLKPGTTKTTSAVYTAAALHALGRDVLLVDADPGQSVAEWADLAKDAGEPFPWETISMARRSAAADLRAKMQRGYTAVVVDTPQIEDHAAIVKGAIMPVMRTWIVPVAPAGIEIHRSIEVVGHMDEVAAGMDYEPDRLALLTRCNRRKPSQFGPDAEAREVLAGAGLFVLPDQVQHNDRLYRQVYGFMPDPAGTPYEALAAELVTREH